MKIKKPKRKQLTIVLLMMLVSLVSAAATLAYLTAKTDTVTNIFTSGAVEIELTETANTDTDNDGTADIWQVQMIPGKEYVKDPVVTVKDSTNVDCYLFVKFEENGNSATYIEYTSTITEANGWTQGDGNNIPANVWYRTVGRTDSVKSWHLLVDDKVTIRDSVTKNNMAEASAANLAYTAYAVQRDELTVIQAWAEVAQN